MEVGTTSFFRPRYPFGVMTIQSSLPSQNGCRRDCEPPRVRPPGVTTAVATSVRLLWHGWVLSPSAYWMRKRQMPVELLLDPPSTSEDWGTGAKAVTVRKKYRECEIPRLPAPSLDMPQIHPHGSVAHVRMACDTDPAGRTWTHRRASFQCSAWADRQRPVGDASGPGHAGVQPPVLAGCHAIRLDVREFELRESVAFLRLLREEGAPMRTVLLRTAEALEQLVAVVNSRIP